MVRAATDPQTGAVDTRKLASLVVDAARSDPVCANAAYQAIEQQLGAGDRGRLAEDVRAAGRPHAATENDRSNTVPGPSTTGAAHGSVRAGEHAAGRGAAIAAEGTRRLADNPILSIQWENTRSAWNNEIGFSQPLRDALTEAGITVNPANNVPPAGSVGPGRA